MTVTAWTRVHLAALSEDPATSTPVIPDAGLPRLLPGMDFWDLWPVRTPDGAVADVHGYEVWAGLSAPALGHPGGRHDVARIRLVGRRRDLPASGWEDLGPQFPDEASAGSREWAGATVYDPSDGSLTAYYTAAGVRGEPRPTFRQRIMGTRGRIAIVDGRPVPTDWGPHTEVVAADGVRYLPAAAAEGVPGFIKAFRDPFPFRDPATGVDYLLFTGSMADSRTDFNGCIGIARRSPDGDWDLLDPLVTADGVNNELERPQLLRRDGRYLLFFSTQARTFHPDCPGPTGLYALTAEAVDGPYEPVNGSGLLLRNPPEEPFQAYSWMVLPDLTTVGFVDSFALHGRHPDDLEAEGEHAVRRHFGGTMTPVSQLHVAGTRGWVSPHGSG